MNQQMSFAFEDGGLRDDGMMRDPVSGNEVPPGSTAKEVRDDIPAQLSEGEYVVPADVVRYYGVKFFEDLRDNAKMGLQDMEARGRIGGEPVPAGGPMDYTPTYMQTGITKASLLPEAPEWAVPAVIAGAGIITLLAIFYYWR